MENKPDNEIIKIILCGLFVALIAAGASINVPLGPFSFTLQYLFVLLATLLLGRFFSTLAIIFYCILGLVGLPVFSSGGGGLSYLIKPTFGYIFGYIFASIITSCIVYNKKKPSYKRVFAGCFAGLITILVVGAIYYFAIIKAYTGVSTPIKMLVLNQILALVPGYVACIIVSVFIFKKLYPVLIKFNFV